MHRSRFAPSVCSVALLFLMIAENQLLVHAEALEASKRNPNSEAQGSTAQAPDLTLLLQKANAHMGQQQFAQAEAVLRQAVGTFPAKLGLWNQLGYALHAQKKYDQALEAYEKVKGLPQFKVTALYNIACVHSLMNRKDLAFRSLRLAITAGYANYGQLQADTDFDNIRSDERFQKLLPAPLSDDELFVEPTRILHKWVGEAAGDEFGWTARRAGDVDKDGKQDFIATAPSHRNNSGKIYLYSGKSGELLHSVTGKPGERLGNSAVGVGDVNADGVLDFAAGAPNSGAGGAAYVFSGKDASVLHTFAGQTSKAQFGYEVSELGDIDGDGSPDVFVGAMAGKGAVAQSGRGVAFSGKTGEELFVLGGERAGDGFGNAAACVQLDSKAGAGECLLAIGAQDAGPSKRGRVYVYHVVKTEPKLRFTIEGDANSANLGQMFISFPSDFDRDGVPDVYASDFSDKTAAPGGGKVVVHSGKSGEQLLVIYGRQPGEGLGTSPSDAGDVDGDGIGDLVIGAWQNREGAPSGGKVYLYSCANGAKLLRSWTCKQSGDTLGFDATGIGDLDDDGKIDFLLTSAWSNAKGAKTGRVFVVAGD